MISFFVTANGRFGIDNYLKGRGAELTGRVNVVLYEDLAALTQLPKGGTIFAALDQASPTAVSATQQICDQLSTPNAAVPVLNTPTKAFRRYELLRRLFADGCNRFNVIRAGDDPSTLRYPVFIRCEHRHDGSETPLLHDRHALDRALGELVMRGMPLSDLLIVEFCDTSRPDGLFRKYSAMRVGDVIIPRHLHAGASWVVKSQTSIVNEALVREELDYVTGDPHGSWLSRVFDLAHIEFGRIDYGVYQGAPQVWEINMNPTFARGTKPSGEARRDAFGYLRDASRAVLNQRLLDAFKSLDHPGPAHALPIVIDGTLRTRLRSEVRARRRSARLASIARAVIDSRFARVVKDAVRPALTHIAPAVARLVRHRG